MVRKSFIWKFGILIYFSSLVCVCSVCVYGGGARREQGNILAQKPEIVVATPGRLEDFISTGLFNYNLIFIIHLFKPLRTAIRSLMLGDHETRFNMFKYIRLIQ